VSAVATTPVSATPATNAPPASAPRPRVGELRDAGSIRRESVDADRWSASGLVKVTGDANVGEGTLDGTVSVGGRLVATNVRYRGMLDLDGVLEATGSFSGSGALRAGSTMHAGTADLTVTVRSTGAVTIDRTLRVRGSISAPSLSVGAELDLDGEAHVPGDLSAGTVSARFKEDSTVGTLRAKSAVLRVKPPNLVERIYFRTVTARIARLEADTAELDGVEVTFVRAPQIVLGRNAHVTQYEGTIVKRHPTSRVGYESKSPAPYGLRR